MKANDYRELFDDLTQALKQDIITTLTNNYDSCAEFSYEDKIRVKYALGTPLVSKVLVKEGELYFQTALYGCTGKFICESGHLEPLTDRELLLDIWDSI